ncbi:hypothetical protein ABKT63_18000 [Enterobacter hormaechei]
MPAADNAMLKTSFKSAICLSLASSSSSSASTSRVGALKHGMKLSFALSAAYLNARLAILSMLLIGRLFIAIILTAKMATFWVCAYVAADIALNSFSARPFFHIIFMLAVTAQLLSFPHIFFAARAAV